LKKKLTLVLILSSVLFLSSKSYSKEITNKTDRKMQKLFATQIENQYTREFKYNIQSFNSKNHTVGSIAKLSKNLPEYEAYAGLKLPKINVENNVATIKISNNSIIFTPDSLFEGFVLLNNHKVNIRNVEYKEIEKALNDKKKTSYLNSIINLVIEQALAEQDKFEVLIFSTIIAINYDFNTSWCFFESCDQEKGRRNLDTVMREMSKQAQDCELYGIEPSILDEMADFSTNKSMHDDLSDKLEGAFSDYSVNELTCQRFVENYHQKEIKERTSRVERRGYGGVLSDQAEENKVLNEKDFNAYVTRICQPYVDLRNCLVKEHRQAQAIHDETRGSGKAGAWRQYEEIYKPEARTGATNR